MWIQIFPLSRTWPIKDTSGVFREIGRLLERVPRYRLTIIAVSGMISLVVAMTYILSVLVQTSTDRARAIRQEIFDRDLREVVGRFDADERNVLEKNLFQLLPYSRTITPLLLPRQYFAALPKAPSTATPRPPPRNCFVDLIPVGRGQSWMLPNPDRFCAYFTENPAVGRYLFFSISYADPQIVPLQRGDAKRTADGIVATTTDQCR
jgi:hypothetical protein